MSDIVLSSKRKVNIFDRMIQSIVIAVNMVKMNRAIDEHLQNVSKCDKEEERQYQENILREIVFVKYQYDIMQREMYELKISYPDEVIDNINSTDKSERLELQKVFLEMEYDRVTKTKFKTKEEVKYSLLVLSSTIDTVKQNIKDEGKNKRYNELIKTAEEIDTLIQTDNYKEEKYKEIFEVISDYVDYINDNYDISKLPSDERELIEFVIETMIKGVESDLDKHLYEFNLLINICKSSYRYYKIVDKTFSKLQKIYDESLVKEIINIKDYIKMYKDIYEKMIKTKVNDVHRLIKTEDEYLEFSRLVTSDLNEELQKFLLNAAKESSENDIVKNIISDELEKYEEENENEVEAENENENENDVILELDDVVKKNEEVKEKNEEKSEEKDEEIIIDIEENLDEEINEE